MRRLSFPKSVASFQLLDSQRCSDIGQIVLVARANNFIIPRAFISIPIPGIQTNAMETHHSHAIGPIRILSRRHASFTCRNCLRCIERETSDVTDRANFLAVISGRQRMSCILYHFQIVMSGKLKDRVHITRLAAEMDRNNRLRPWSYGAFDSLRINI